LLNLGSFMFGGAIIASPGFNTILISIRFAN